MRNDLLVIRNFKNGTDTDPLFMGGDPIIISTFSYSSGRMGASQLSAELRHPLCLDDYWDKTQYVSFRGENYFIVQTPSSSKDNEDDRYRHDIVFVSGRDILKDVYFFDVVSETPNTNDKYVSNSTKVVFMGTLNEFVVRLNRSFVYSNLEYRCVIDEGISTDAKLISFEDKYIMEVLQESYNIFDIPFYFDGVTIHFGYTNNAITQPFRYGHDSELLTINKTNANYKIVNRITAVGSEDNIPHYYPNPSDDRAAIEAAGGKWITPCGSLMPPIYRESKGANRFYNAINGTYPIPESDPLSYYYFDNEYKESNPKEFKVNFPDIKPTIKGITNASSQRIDAILDVAFDTNDNDELDENNEYKHPYFYVKLNKFDGTYGFNLFDQSIAKQEMQLSLISGNCAACTFTIGVDEELQKNIVQVDENGNLKRDANGNVIRSGKPQDKQNNTIVNNVWIALKKDVDTFGIIMPNAEFKYKPAANDTFVLIGINLPQAYITSAEERLKQAMIKYMAENNSEKFNFTIDFSRIYLANNPLIADQLNENARILLEYNNVQYALYISNYSYRKVSDELLPEISIELSDTITVVKGQLENAINEAKDDIMSSFNSIDVLKQGLKHFLRKDVIDRAKARLFFDAGLSSSDVQSDEIIIGEFLDGLLGIGGKIWSEKGSKKSKMIIDDAYFRRSLTVPKIIFDTIKAVGGKFWFTDTHTITNVIKSGQTYICDLDLQQGEYCTWAKDDCLTGISQSFDANGNFTGFQTVECLVISVDNNKATLAPRVEVLPPKEGLILNRCGNITNTNRQSSVFLSSEFGGWITLIGMNSWTIGKGNIGAASGDLSKLSSIISMPELTGMSALYKNVLMYGKFFQIDDISGGYIPIPRFMGDWYGSVKYAYYDEVTHLGRRFLCINENGLEGVEPFKGSANWLCTVDKGEDGDKWNYCEEWKPDQVYKRGDVVLYGRDTYMYQWHEPSQGYYPDAQEYFALGNNGNNFTVLNNAGQLSYLNIKTQKNRVWALMAKGGLDGDAAFKKQYSPDKIIIHTEYLEGDIWSRDKVGLADWSIWYKIKGESANEPNFMFKFAKSKPTLVSGTASVAQMMADGWSDIPPPVRPEGFNLWQVFAKFNEYGNIIASWSEPYSPDGEDGKNGTDIQVQYAVSQDSVDWHYPFRDGDSWERQSTDGGKTWTIPFRCVGEKGDKGDTSPYTENQYIKHGSWSTPPSQSASGWQDVPFAAIETGLFVWKRERKVTPPTPAESWGAPYVVSGEKGQDGESMNPKGEWDSMTPYFKNDVVTYLGRTYIARKNVPFGTAPIGLIATPILSNGSSLVINGTSKLNVIKEGSLYWDKIVDKPIENILWSLESSINTIVFGSLGFPSPSAYQVKLNKTVDNVSVTADKLWIATRYFDGKTWSRLGNAVNDNIVSITVRSDATMYETRVYAGQFDAEDWKDNYLAITSVARADSGKDGSNAPLLKLQYSPDGISNWSDTFRPTDLFAKSSNNNGATWSNPYRIVGENGDNGINGEFVNYQFAKGSLTAATGTWQDAPPTVSKGEYIWMRNRKERDNVALTEWTTPVRISGNDGSNGVNPEIKNGYWWIGDVNTGIKAQGDKGETPHIGSNGNWWIGSTDTGIKAQGDKGETGATGSIPRNCGFFKANTPYVWDANFRDIVIHAINGVNYQFAVKAFGSTVQTAPTSAEGDANWDSANKFEFVSTQLLLAEQAVIDNLVARMVSTSATGARIQIIGTMMSIFGNVAKNIDFGVDESGMAVMKYYNNEGQLLYNLGPKGIDWGSIQPASWSTVKLVQVIANPTNDSLPDWYDVDDQMLGLPLSNSSTYYKYFAGTNPEITPDEKDKERYLFSSKSTSGSKISDGWYCEAWSGKYKQYMSNETGQYIKPDGDKGIYDTLSGVVDLSPIYQVQLKLYRRGVLTKTANVYWSGAKPQ